MTDEYERARRERLLLSPGWLASLYPGVCISCETPYPAGTPIRRADVLPGWVADCCADTVE